MTSEFYIVGIEKNADTLLLRGAADGKITLGTVFTEVCTRIAVKDTKGVRLEKVGKCKSIQINVHKLITYELEVKELYDQSGAIIVNGVGLELINIGDTLCSN